MKEPTFPLRLWNTIFLKLLFALFVLLRKKPFQLPPGSIELREALINLPM
jgi:hypothetical protein